MSGISFKYALYGGLAAVALGAARYVGRVQETGENLVFNPTVQGVSGSFTELTLKVHVDAVNPGPAALRMQWPYLEIFYKGTRVANSDPKPTNVPLPVGTTPIGPIMLHISLPALIGAAWPTAKELLTAWSQRKPVVLTVRTLTTVDGKFTSDTTKEVTLLNAA